ncbi:hypothetical protein DGG96_01265 [Legionella qingyii]|uniref:Uncharacterized protein n=1 Tax=Legionella qingyii TaxID=2184757 RepID=A0A317U6R9_9GAMM|nr:hypothetical protein [Legionella qingyii]PWY57005.1 hypothetical protein DGG96_03160 [Legionella qingyii]PWY57373.1 hypothetical protein DGG96_01265 [Legionella qingyii]RUR26462.1 hypothetical protein ELY20_00670 [Legionella qingyii]
MLKLLLADCDQNMKIMAAQQLAELEKNCTEHGAHFDFAPLLTALKQCADNIEVWSDEQTDKYWITTAGGCQKALKIHS